MSIVWSGVSNRGHKHRGTVPILGLCRTVAEFQREGLLVLFVCGALGLDSAHDLLRCCVTRGDMSIVWSGVSTTEGTNIAGRCLY